MFALDYGRNRQMQDLLSRFCFIEVVCLERFKDIRLCALFIVLTVRYVYYRIVYCRLYRPQ